MSYLLKDLYSVSFYNKFSAVLAKILPAFDQQKFIDSIFTNDWKSKELKDRMKHTAEVLHGVLPADFIKASGLIDRIIKQLQDEKFTNSSLEFMFFPHYIETYGLNHFDTSVKSLENITQFTSCEFAVRPFIIKYGDKMVKQMYHWSLHKNEHVRRLASEGIRPRLPWAIALPAFKKDPAPILPLLENLKTDPSEYVRRSVANNLNDISKDNPETVLAIAKQWKGIRKETDAIIKHGCRTLLKKGHSGILKYFGLSGSHQILITDFIIDSPEIKIGDYLVFSFTVQNNETKPQTIRLEYGMSFLKSNGQYSKKVFKINERIYKPTEKLELVKRHSFRIITTKKYYAGKQKISIIVNGIERAEEEFILSK